jgi:hypothetical protein
MIGTPRQILRNQMKEDEMVGAYGMRRTETYVYRTFTEKSEGRLRRRRYHNIKMEFWERVWEGVDGVHQTKNMVTMEGFCEYDNGPTRFIKKWGNSTLDEPKFSFKSKQCLRS